MVHTRTLLQLLLGSASLFAVAGCGTAGMDMGSSSGGGGHEMAAPTITEVMKMAGALHVQWTNNTSGCDTIEAERKEDSGEFSASFSVPGDVDNKMDSSATEDKTYTYRLRCVMAGGYSAYSNEKSENPVQ